MRSGGLLQMSNCKGAALMTGAFPEGQINVGSEGCDAQCRDPFNWTESADGKGALRPRG
jgi:hypothetical protein